LSDGLPRRRREVPRLEIAARSILPQRRAIRVHGYAFCALLMRHDISPRLSKPVVQPIRL